MKKWLILALAASFSFIFKVPADENPRIMDLMPNFVEIPAINPAIPDDFVAISPPKHLDWIYWGPKDVLLAYFKDPKSLSQPILRLRLSHNVSQTGPSQFSDEDRLLTLPGITQQKLQWGTYPVQAVRYQANDHLILLARVGLNSLAQDTLLFQMLYPVQNDSLKQKALELWDRFMTQTSALSEQDILKVKGHDLNDGYTIVTINGTKLKVTAEQRVKDGKLRIAAIPLESDVKLKPKKVVKGLMECQWKHGEPLAKVYGTITSHNDQRLGTVVQEQVTDVLIRSVEQFSPVEKPFIIHEE
jgi:hypothetical protein